MDKQNKQNKQIVVRRSVFETNSSSSHSITLCEGSTGDFNSIEHIKHSPDELVIETGEFGWEIDDHYDFFTKASYLYTYAHQMNDVDALKLLYKVIKKATNKKPKVKRSQWEGIDHQSIECPQALLRADDAEELVYNFLFCNKSCVNTDNDNH